MDLHIRGDWEAIGELDLDSVGDLVFPIATRDPLVYAFSFRDGSKKSIYVGEAVDLRRRFTHYRRPSKRQQTNIRMNSLMKQELAAGRTVDVQVFRISDVRLQGKVVTADLSRKPWRHVLEGAAQVSAEAEGFELLNL
jgi:hypothetical protein